MWLQGLIVIVLFVVCFVVGYFVGRNNPVIYDRKKEEINSAIKRARQRVADLPDEARAKALRALDDVMRKL